MEFNKPISNPMLMGAIELMKADNTPEHQRMLSDEIMKAHFLCPATVTPIPEPDAKGEIHLGPENHVQFPVIAAHDGKKFFMAFTDMQEFKKWKNSEEQQTLTMTFDDYAVMMFRKDSQGNQNLADGFMINPLGERIVVPKEQLAQYLTVKMQQQKGKTIPPKPDK